MNQISGFFNAPSADDFNKVSNPELIYSAEEGFIQLWRAGRGGRIRAYKALKPQFRGDPLYEGLLRKEFEIGYSLNHPNVCEYLSFCGEEAFGNCIEMEWVDGDGLDRILSTGACKNPYHILDQVCDALSYLHSRGVVHRDLKPSNILVTHNGGIVKLIDFGFADTDSHYALKQPAGTRAYAAPELLAGEAVDCRADIWSLGCIIAGMLPSRRRVAQKCMQRNPDLRYSSASQVKAALHSHLVPVWAWVVLGLILAALVAAYVFGPDIHMLRESPETKFGADSALLFDMQAADSVSVPDPGQAAIPVQSPAPPRESARIRGSSGSQTAPLGGAARGAAAPSTAPAAGASSSAVSAAGAASAAPATGASPSDSASSASVEALFEKASRLIEDAGK